MEKSAPIRRRSFVKQLPLTSRTPDWRRLKQEPTKPAAHSTGINVKTLFHRLQTLTKYKSGRLGTESLLRAKGNFMVSRRGIVLLGLLVPLLCLGAAVKDEPFRYAEAKHGPAELRYIN